MKLGFVLGSSVPIMSALEAIKTVISQPLEALRSFFGRHNAELRSTQIPDVYMVKLTEKTKVSDPEIQPFKGLMFNHKTTEVRSCIYPVPIEVKDMPEADRDQLLASLSQQSCTVTEAIDGTMFRYAYFPEIDQWLLSTVSKEKASEAFWMNRVSFETQFNSVPGLKLDPTTFDRNHIHLFVMCHPLNVIVVPVDEPKIYHVATYDRQTLEEIEVDLGLPKPKIFALQPHEVLEATQTAKEQPVRLAGYMVQVKDGPWTRRYRFENGNYTYAKNLRGNSNNINFTLLELRQDDLRDDKQDLKEFLSYYPQYQGGMDQLNDRISRLVSLFYSQYGKRYKDQQNIRVHRRHHKFLGEIHQKLFRDILKPMGKTVQRSDIAKFVDQLPAAKLLYLLNYIHDNGQPASAPNESPSAESNQEGPSAESNQEG